MIIATWNVNSVRARLERLTSWLERHRPDVLCLQELKVTDDNFPIEAIEQLGYTAAVHGQKTYNGVALLSRTDIIDVHRGFNDGEDDPQARYLEGLAVTPECAVRVASIYLPNGNPVGTDKFPYKIAWLGHFEKHARELLAFEEPLLLAGDYNVIPEPDDCYDPAAWQDDALFQPQSRDAFKRVRNLGFVDAVRACDPGTGAVRIVFS